MKSFVSDKVLEKIRNWEMGYEVVDIIFRDLGRIDGVGNYEPVEMRYERDEEELGDEIPRAVVEAQRRFTKSGFYTIEDITGEADFRTQLALRGLGNLKELRMQKHGMHMRSENAVLPLILVGMFQGFFEMSFDLRSSDVEWQVSEEGDLEMEATPRS